MMFNITRKSVTVRVGDTDVTLYEPSALERSKYAEKLVDISDSLAGVEMSENKRHNILIRSNLEANLFLIACCLRYGVKNESFEDIQDALKDLPADIFSALTNAAYTLAGLAFKDEDGATSDDSEKK